jgi:alkanesulfonate monooxygenase SsuD/methylene tetrahydromethanopterin reductase-like flavin-dependent oxidoreductase (luciferase family)
LVALEHDLRVGVVLRQQDMENHGRRLASLTADIAAAGIDHVTVGDHVSFAGGTGADGLIQATALLVAHPRLPVETGVYLLPLRHPATVARQLATLCSLAPGRLTFGVGVGGDDRHELELCGVDPRTRGARMDESLTLLRDFLTGREVDFRGRFFEVEAASIRPAPTPRPPIVVGGRSDAALARAGRLGDGWIGVWVSPRRFGEAIATVQAAADAAGRAPGDWRHALQLWAGFGATPEAAERRVGAVMERAYGIPFERFSRYVPRGTPGDVAAALRPYVDAGCRRFNVVPEAETLEAALEAVGAVKRSLTGSDTRRAGGRPSRVSRL